MSLLTRPDYREIALNATAALLAVDDDEFKRMVDEDLRHANTPEMQAALRSPEVIDRFHSMLQRMLRSAEGQLAAKTADLEALRARLQRQGKSAKNRTDFLREKESYEKWRAGNLRFKAGLEQALIEVRRLRDSSRHPMFESLAVEERNWALERVRSLTEAIRRHQQAFPTDDEPSEADLDLWALAAPAKDAPGP